MTITTQNFNTEGGLALRDFLRAHCKPNLFDLLPENFDVEVEEA
jgi:hypothetical protein